MPLRTRHPPNDERKEHSTDRPHPNSYDKDMANYPNLELRDGFRIPVNLFWTTSRTFPMLQNATSTPKIGSRTMPLRTRHSPNDEMKEHSTDRPHPNSYDKDWLTHSNLELRIISEFL